MKEGKHLIFGAGKRRLTFLLWAICLFTMSQGLEAFHVVQCKCCGIWFFFVYNYWIFFTQISNPRTWTNCWQCIFLIAVETITFHIMNISKCCGITRHLFFRNFKIWQIISIFDLIYHPLGLERHLKIEAFLIHKTMP